MFPRQWGSPFPLLGYSTARCPVTRGEISRRWFPSGTGEGQQQKLPSTSPWELQKIGGSSPQRKHPSGERQAVLNTSLQEHEGAGPEQHTEPAGATAEQHPDTVTGEEQHPGSQSAQEEGESAQRHPELTQDSKPRLGGSPREDLNGTRAAAASAVGEGLKKAGAEHGPGERIIQEAPVEPLLSEQTIVSGLVVQSTAEGQNAPGSGICQPGVEGSARSTPASPGEMPSLPLLCVRATGDSPDVWGVGHAAPEPAAGVTESVSADAESASVSDESSHSEAEAPTAVAGALPRSCSEGGREGPHVGFDGPMDRRLHGSCADADGDAGLGARLDSLGAFLIDVNLGQDALEGTIWATARKLRHGASLTNSSRRAKGFRSLSTGTPASEGVEKRSNELISWHAEGVGRKLGGQRLQGKGAKVVGPLQECLEGGSEGEGEGAGKGADAGGVSVHAREGAGCPDAGKAGSTDRVPFLEGVRPRCGLEAEAEGVPTVEALDGHEGDAEDGEGGLSCIGAEEEEDEDEVARCVLLEMWQAAWEEDHEEGAGGLEDGREEGAGEDELGEVGLEEGGDVDGDEEHLADSGEGEDWHGDGGNDGDGDEGGGGVPQVSCQEELGMPLPHLRVRISGAGASLGLDHEGQCAMGGWKRGKGGAVKGKEVAEEDGEEESTQLHQSKDGCSSNRGAAEAQASTAHAEASEFSDRKQGGAEEGVRESNRGRELSFTDLLLQGWGDQEAECQNTEGASATGKVPSGSENEGEEGEEEDEALTLLLAKIDCELQRPLSGPATLAAHAAAHCDALERSKPQPGNSSLYAPESEALQGGMQPSSSAAESEAVQGGMEPGGHSGSRAAQGEVRQEAAEPEDESLQLRMIGLLRELSLARRTIFLSGLAWQSEAQSSMVPKAPRGAGQTPVLLDAQARAHKTGGAPKRVVQEGLEAPGMGSSDPQLQLRSAAVLDTPQKDLSTNGDDDRPRGAAYSRATSCLVPPRGPRHGAAAGSLGSRGSRVLTDLQATPPYLQEVVGRLRARETEERDGGHCPPSKMHSEHWGGTQEGPNGKWALSSTTSSVDRSGSHHLRAMEVGPTAPFLGECLQLAPSGSTRGYTKGTPQYLVDVQRRLGGRGRMSSLPVESSSGKPRGCHGRDGELHRAAEGALASGRGGGPGVLPAVSSSLKALQLSPRTQPLSIFRESGKERFAWQGNGGSMGREREGPRIRGHGSFAGGCGCAPHSTASSCSAHAVPGSLGQKAIQDRGKPQGGAEGGVGTSTASRLSVKLELDLDVLGSSSSSIGSSTGEEENGGWRSARVSRTAGAGEGRHRHASGASAKEWRWAEGGRSPRAAVAAMHLSPRGLDARGGRQWNQRPGSHTQKLPETLYPEFLRTRSGAARSDSGKAGASTLAFHAGRAPPALPPSSHGPSRKALAPLHGRACAMMRLQGIEEDNSEGDTGRRGNGTPGTVAGTRRMPGWHPAEQKGMRVRGDCDALLGKKCRSQEVLGPLPSTRGLGLRPGCPSAVVLSAEPETLTRRKSRRPVFTTVGGSSSPGDKAVAEALGDLNVVALEQKLQLISLQRELTTAHYQSFYHGLARGQAHQEQSEQAHRRAHSDALQSKKGKHSQAQPRSRAFGGLKVDLSEAQEAKFWGPMSCGGRLGASPTHWD